MFGNCSDDYDDEYENRVVEIWSIMHINAIDMALSSFSVPYCLLDSDEMKPMYDACNMYHGLRRSKQKMLELKNNIAIMEKKIEECLLRHNSTIDLFIKAAIAAELEDVNEEADAVFKDYTDTVIHETKFLNFVMR